MTEALRYQIVQRHQQGASIRTIAKELAISRGAVSRVLARLEAQRAEASVSLPPPRRRGSIIDEYEPILKELLQRYPNLTGERARQELQARGYRGGYTTVRERVRLLRPRPAAPVIRRILAAGARPKPLLGELADLHREAIDPRLCQDAIGPRPTSDYQHLLLSEEADETPAEEQPQDQPGEVDRGTKPA